MSAGRYRRATKKHAVCVQYTDGSELEGFVPVPLGMDFVGVLMQAQGFMQFETADGEVTFLNVSAIKRITSQEKEEDSAQAGAQTSADRARTERRNEQARRREAEEKAQSEQNETVKQSKPVWSGEEYDALDILGLKPDATRNDVQSAYRKLVKLYHPDRLRGLGVSAKKIEFAAERLAEINTAYRVVMAATALAA